MFITSKIKSEDSLEAVVQRIEILICDMMDFWKNAHGWASIEAAALLNKSMLGWQSSLAKCLQMWKRPSLTDGELILAWSNIGSLVEGQLKLFLSVYYQDYIADIDAIKKNKSLSIIDPDALMPEDLRVFFNKKIWEPSEPWGKWIFLIQQRRNAIHAYKFKEIGTTEELHSNIRCLLEFVHMIKDRLPYPDDALYRG